MSKKHSSFEDIFSDKELLDSIIFGKYSVPFKLYVGFAIKNDLRKKKWKWDYTIPCACGLLMKNIAERPDCLHLD